MKKFVAVSLLIVSASAQAVNYNVQLLPSLTTGSNGWAYGLNDNGTVVGQSVDSAGVKTAVMWNNGVITSLGVQGLARAVNNAGTVVGETGNISLGNPNGRAFKYEGGVLTDIGDLGGPISGAYDINESGVITGFACTDTNFACIFRSSGFRYEGGSMTDLGTVSSPTGYSRGHGINDAGAIAGRASLVDFSGSEKHMATWDAANNLTSVVGPVNYSTAQQINNSGIKVGNGYNGASANGDMRGLVWDAANNITQILGTFGGKESRAWSINDVGTVVGYAEVAGDAERAMVSYDGGATLLNLNSLVVDLTGWASLDEAYDINESGQIVGIGTLSTGERGAFLLTAVPVPAAVWLFISAIAALFGFRRSVR